MRCLQKVRNLVLDDSLEKGPEVEFLDDHCCKLDKTHVRPNHTRGKICSKIKRLTPRYMENKIYRSSVNGARLKTEATYIRKPVEILRRAG